ncbi:ATP-binding cassette domain-containing protein [Rhodococcus erythropolis]
MAESARGFTGGSDDPSTVSTPDLQTPVLSCRGIRKRFGRTEVLRGIDLDLRPGEFVGLMGPNGAGKSTLIKVLSGVYESDSGSLQLDNGIVKDLADCPEIGFVHQDLGLIDDMSVMDNLRLGAPPLRLIGPILHRTREIEAARDALRRVNLGISLGAAVGTLSPGEKALVAVARLLYGGARLIVVDEATSTLPPNEARWFIEALRAETAKGTCVLMVSHKLSELMSVARRLVLIIDGEKVADRYVTPDDRAEVVQMLANHEEDAVHDIPDGVGTASELGAELLRMDTVRHGSVGPVDLVLRKGEVVGLTGLVGSGLHTVGLLAHGAVRPTHGRVTVPRGTKRAIVAPQRETQGGVGDLSVLWNATLTSLRRWRSPLRLLNLRAERREAVSVLTGLSVVPADPDIPFAALSGGNQQKVLFARTLLENPELYVLCEPTRGVDVQTRREIYRLIGTLRNKGAGVLVVTSDSEDLFAVCDRIGVLTADGLSRFDDAAALTESQLEEVL